MSIIRYRDYHPLPPFQPYEIRYLRESLGWSQTKLAEFLGRTRMTIYRWEQGGFAPDEVTLGLLHRLWEVVFGDYDGPYANMYAEDAEGAPSMQVSDDRLSTIAKALLIGGVAFFLAKGLMIDEEE